MIMNEPLVSVLLPSYNAASHIEEALRSIMEQSYRHLEIIVIDDGSTDDSVDIVRELAQTDSRIRLIRNKENQQLARTLNAGLQAATGKYVARIDADDIALPMRIEKQVAYLEAHPEIGIVGTFIEVFNDRGKRRKSRLPVSDEKIRAYLYTYSPFFHPTVMIRRECLDRHQLRYDPQYRIGQDHAFWVDILKHSKGANLPEILLKYRLGGGSITATSNRDRSERRKILSMIYKKVLASNGIELSSEDHAIYAASMAKQDTIALPAANVRKILRIYDQVLSKAGENGTDVSCLKDYLSLRFIAYLRYSGVYKKPAQLARSIISSYFYTGLTMVIRKMTNSI